MATPWGELQESINAVHREWRSFRGERPSGLKVRPSIIRSWQRCQEAGVADRLPGGSIAPSLNLWRANHDLLTAAAPVLSNLKESLRDTGQVLVLCDSSARAILVEGDRSARQAAERINLVPDSDWSERASGTNAMGTALAEVSHITVFATEHYLEDLHPWGCVAAPIIHPLSGQVMGVLDLSGRHMVINQHTEMAVQGAVQAIQSRIAAQEAADHEVLLGALADRIASLRHGGVGVIDRHGLLLRFNGLNLPRRGSWSHVLERLRGEGEFEEALPEAPSLRLHYRPILREGQTLGALLEISRPVGPSLPSVEPPLPGLVGRDPRWLAALERAAKGARSDPTILLSGETGTGKEVVARAIHQASARAGGPFIALNCGALPPSLAVSELFGYVGGAFTGANPRGRPGVFEMAQKGTLFLDEVSELSPEAQIALLRVLQEREVVRIGTHQPIKVDVRVIAASNRDLADLVAKGLFRQDLFFRLNVLPVLLPPLRERPQDIIPLIAHGYQRLSQEPPSLPPVSWQRLLDHRWPGNVRELLNLVEQAVALNEDPADLLPLPSLPVATTVSPGDGGEEEQIRRALDEHQGNAAAAARALGMSRSTLYRKLELYQIRLKRQAE